MQLEWWLTKCHWECDFILESVFSLREYTSNASTGGAKWKCELVDQLKMSCGGDCRASATNEFGMKWHANGAQYKWKCRVTRVCK